MKIYLTVALFIACSVCINAFSQSTGSPTTGNPTTYPDTNFIFTSPHPLIDDGNTVFAQKNISGFELLLSPFGFGFGLIYERIINKDYKFASELFFTEVKNTDELELLIDYYLYEYRVPNKIRRLYSIPLNMGIHCYIDIGSLNNSFRPFWGVMVTPTLIWEMPYEDNWFRDVKYSKSHFRIGAGVQIGADFGAFNTSLLSVRMRYIYTPFGGDGLESVINSPIQNFGGFYISLALGFWH